MTTTYTFDGTIARLDTNKGILTVEDADLPGGRWTFYHDPPVVRRFSRFSRETLAVAVAAAMPGYMAGGAFTPFIADRIAWIASKVANRASLESLDTRRTR